MCVYIYKGILQCACNMIWNLAIKEMKIEPWYKFQGRGKNGRKRIREIHTWITNFEKDKTHLYLHMRNIWMWQIHTRYTLLCHLFLSSTFLWNLNIKSLNLEDWIFSEKEKKKTRSYIWNPQIKNYNQAKTQCKHKSMFEK